MNRRKAFAADPPPAGPVMTRPEEETLRAEYVARMVSALEAGEAWPWRWIAYSVTMLQLDEVATLTQATALRVVVAKLVEERIRNSDGTIDNARFKLEERIGDLAG